MLSILQSRSVEVRKISRLERYFVPPRSPEEFKVCRLRPFTLVGFMEMGKTTTELKLMKDIGEVLYEKYKLEPLNIVSKNIIDALKWLDDNKDLLRDLHYVNLFVDDVLFSGMSTERTKNKRLAEKIYANIRHELEKRGFHGVLRLSFAGQRWRLIPPFFRNSPYVDFKDVITHDREEKWWISRMVGKDYYEFLKYISKKAFDQWDDEVKRYSVARHFTDGPFILDIEKPERPKEIFEVPLGYSDVGIDVNDVLSGGKKKYRRDELLLAAIITAKKIDPKLGWKRLAALMREQGFQFDDHVFFDIYKKAVKVLEKTS